MEYFCVPAVSGQMDLTTSHIKTFLFAEEQFWLPSLNNQDYSTSVAVVSLV